MAGNNASWLSGHAGRSKKRNDWIRNQTNVYDIIKSVRLKKSTQEGHLARRNDDRWTLRLTIWRPWLGKEAKADNVCDGLMTSQDL